MPDLLFVAGEAPWPAVHGGRIRAARMIEALARRLDVGVVAPKEVESPAGITLDVLPNEPPPPWLQAALAAAPRLGQTFLGPARRRALVRAVELRRPRAVLFARSYLAAMAPDLGVPLIVDFADVERRRSASFARRGSPRNRVAAGTESLKAVAWERRIARRADVGLATTPADEQLLASWGARTLLVPHGADAAPYLPSPPDGPVTFVASMGYPPNQDAARLLVDEVWPRLRRLAPGARLRLVGREADRGIGWTGQRDGVEVIADPPSVDPFFRDASVVVVPVRSGGGAQVKVVEALARCRVVVATPFSARSVPAGAGRGVVVADGPRGLSETAARLWRDVAARHARERALEEGRPVPTWDDVCTPLGDRLAAMVAVR